MKKIRKLKALKALKPGKSLRDGDNTVKKQAFSTRIVGSELLLLSASRFTSFSFSGTAKFQVISGKIEVLGFEIEPLSGYYEIESTKSDFPLEIIVRTPIFPSKPKEIIDLEGVSFDSIDFSACNILVKSKDLASLEFSDPKDCIGFIGKGHSETANRVLRVLDEFPNDFSLRKLAFIGEKSSGKTFSSIFMINFLLKNGKNPYFLDLDTNNGLSLSGTLSISRVIRPILSNSRDFSGFLETKELRFLGESLLNRNMSLMFKSLEDLMMGFSLEKEAVLVVRTQGNQKGLGEVVIIDQISLITPYFVVGCGESPVFTILRDKKEGKLSFLGERKGALRENSEFLTLNKPENIYKSSRKSRKDSNIYRYLFDPGLAKEFEGLLGNFIDGIDDKRPCFMNLMRCSRSYKVPLMKRKCLCLDRENPEAKDLSELGGINPLEYSIVALFCQDNVVKTEEIERRNCIGLGFVKELDEKNQEIEVILNEGCGGKIEKIDLLVKSPEFGFSREFFRGEPMEGLVWRELMEDLGMKSVGVPFVNECFEGVVGDKPYVQRIASKKKKI